MYEVRTYRLKPGTLAECERLFGEALPRREEFSSLGAFWHTEIGPLNEIIHVWPYESLEQRTEVRAQAMQSGAWPPPIGAFIEHMESEIFIPAPFMEPLGARQLGPLLWNRSARGSLARYMRYALIYTDRAPCRPCWSVGPKPFPTEPDSHPWPPAGTAISGRSINLSISGPTRAWTSVTASGQKPPTCPTGRPAPRSCC